MLASDLVNYGIPAAVIVVLCLSFIVYRSRRQAPGESLPSASDAAAAPLADPSLLASSNVPDSTTAHTADTSSVASTGDTVDEDSLEPAKRVESIGVTEVEAHGSTVESGEDEKASVRERTGRTRSLFSSAFASIRGKGKVDDTTWEELEETLLRADIGIGLTTKLLDPLRAAAKAGQIRTADDAINALRDAMTAQLATSQRSLNMDAATKPNVWLFVGVNGVGKTTTIGKIATAEVGHGTTVLLAAGDTFRAAAAEQLQVWAERSGAAFVRGSEGGDPASVIFDGIQSAHARNIDLVLGDTAGRLQNKSNLMEELKKVRRVAEKAEGTVNEVLLVIDATTGQNGLSQAREFAAATDVTGVVLTKLDGSAKGGIVFAIETEMGIPVKLVGLGEGAHDLVAFDPEEYVAALFE
ncbi:MAG: signal recognition particle-docking protein FtsY [Ilumatobacteraceae bacterium]|jgi:fused signal recognition particle receptor|nr:signal recognition particle-docking protein FtsY [Ilumatobacteraceae bacterium]